MSTRLGRRLLVGLFLLLLPLVGTRLRGADEIEYFSYLPSLLVDGDLECANQYEYFYARDPEGLRGFKQTFLERREPATGRAINFGPIGSALLWAPFYLVAHAGVLLARLLGSGVAADGLAQPYVAAACYASALYGCLGLLLLHDLLARHARVSALAATGTVLALAFGSPVLYYLTVAPAFSHANSLFAVSLLLWLWLRRPDGGPGWWALLGAVGGLAALVREQDGLFLIAPGLALLWRLVTQDDRRGTLVRALVMGAAAAAMFVPQLLAYHAINGRYGPSRLVQRKLSWSSPHFFDVLFDPAHGLYAWCPLLLLATLGLGCAFWRARADGRAQPAAAPGWLVTVALGIALLLQVWINGALESWTQAGAFGSRRFVSATPVFAWGLAALLAWLLERRVRLLAMGLVALALWWNVALMVQFGLRLMDRQRLEWPRVAVQQVTVVPARLARTLWLYLTDRERLVQETR